MSRKQESKLKDQEREPEQEKNGSRAGAEEAARPADDEPQSAAGEQQPQGQAADEQPGQEQRAEPPSPEEAGEGSVEEQLAASREESRRNYEKYLRAVADWENYRRRVAREKDELRQYAVGNFIEELLPVLDNLELGLKTADKHPEAAMVTEGFEMVAEQVRQLLSRHGLETVDPHGESFDPHKHESVAYQPDAEHPEGTVIHVVRRGYALNGRLLRPASVVVSSGAPEQEDDSRPKEKE